MKTKTIWTIVIIVGLYVAAQLIADVAATKFIQIGAVVMPGGTLIFALSFTLRDMVHKRLGKEWARAAIVIAAGLNVLLVAYIYLVASLPAPGFYARAEAWSAIFYIIPSITIGSIIAEVSSGWMNTEIYHAWWKKFPKLPQWTRVLSSNAISLPVDSLIFSLLAFVVLPPLFGAESMEFGAAIARVAGGQTLYKLLVAVLSMPLIYTVKEKSVLDE